MPRFSLFFFLLAALSVCAFRPGSRALADAPLDALQRKAQSLESVSADFVQETSLPMFVEPVRSRGRFVFKRPASLRWEYSEPMREGFVLNGDNGFRWDDAFSARKPFAPGSDPLAAIVARQMIAWITFDREALGREYAIQSLPGPDLRVLLTPLREDVKGVISAIFIAFSPQGPASLVEIRETGGGGTSIDFSNVVVNGPLGGQEFE